jgi:hypothetical protein
MSQATSSTPATPAVAADAIAAGQPPQAPAPPTGPPKPRPLTFPQALKKYVLKPAGSLRITVVLFALSIFLVFAGTLAQAEGGIWTVVRDYFRTALVWIPFQVFVKFGQVFLGVSPDLRVGGSFPFPGGWLLGGLMLVNLLAAHALRFRFGWKDLFVLPLFALAVALLVLSETQESGLLLRVSCVAFVVSVAGLFLTHAKRGGVIVIHLGLIVMMLSELITGLYAVEGSMSIGLGDEVNFVENGREFELAVIDRSDPRTDGVVSVPVSLLRKGKGEVIRHHALPFALVVEEYMPNADLGPPGAFPNEKNRATAGDGLQFLAKRLPEVSGADTEGKLDFPTVYLTLKRNGSDESLGTYLVSTYFYSNYTRRQLPDRPQQVRVDGKDYELWLRPHRTYRDFKIRLLEFRHDVFPGTETPKNFSSQVQLLEPTPQGDRVVSDVKIWMNHPLFYRGETFYQSGYFINNQGTVLQVVRNPGWAMPYVSCLLVALGMMVHFGLHLFGFLRRRAAA